jgi:hypothetical protein
MTYAEKPPRTITCTGDAQFPGCGKTEARSPYGPLPKWCIACEGRAHDGRLRQKKRGVVRLARGAA